MKTTFQALLAIILIPSTFVIAQGPYGFNSAYVEKTIETNTSGIIVTTNEIIYIENGGNLVRREVEQEQSMPMMNQVITSRSISITDPEYIITWDPDTNTGTRMANPVNDAFQNMTDDQAQQFGQDMTDAMNTEITETGTGEVAGVMCIINTAVTNMMGMNITTTTWTYENFLMKSTSEGAVTSNEEVSLFNEGVDHDPDLFVVDDNVTITDVTSPFGN
jgi:hypothetical protein